MGAGVPVVAGARGGGDACDIDGEDDERFVYESDESVGDKWELVIACPFCGCDCPCV
jgi:hypothetical protein